MEGLELDCESGSKNKLRIRRTRILDLKEAISWRAPSVGSIFPNLPITSMKNAGFVTKFLAVVLFCSAFIALSQTTNRPPVAGPDMLYQYMSGGTKVSVSTLLTNDFDPDGDPIRFLGVSPVSAHGGTVVSNENWIFYTPPPGFTNTDTFTYTISDGLTSLVTSLVTVNFGTDSGSSLNLAISNLANGTYEIRGDGIPDQIYRIESATNVDHTNWQSLSTARADVVGAFVAIDSNSAPQRLYRSISSQGLPNVTDGLYAWWRLDEGSGTTVADASGNQRNGTFVHSPTWTNGYIGSGLRFHGSLVNPDPMESVVMSNATDNFTNFSVALWVREIDITAHGYLVSKFRQSDGNFGWQVMSESAQLRYGEWDVDNWIETPDTNPDAFISDGLWHHFVACREGTNAWSYKDGSLIRGTLVRVGANVTSISNESNIKLGYNTQYDGHTPNVVLDEVRVYSRVLSADEVKMLYNWKEQP